MLWLPRKSSSMKILQQTQSLMHLKLFVVSLCLVFDFVALILSLIWPHFGHPYLQVLPGEPVYAQVNRDKKKNSRNHAADLAHHQPAMHPNSYQDYGDHADHWQVANHHGVPLDPQQQIAAANHSGNSGQAAGDSWVWTLWQWFFEPRSSLCTTMCVKIHRRRETFAWDSHWVWSKASDLWGDLEGQKDKNCNVHQQVYHKSSPIISCSNDYWALFLKGWSNLVAMYYTIPIQHYYYCKKNIIIAIIIIIILLPFFKTCWHLSFSLND